MKSYAANALNQYTAIANPDAVGLRGSATNTATVTVNGSAALSDGIASDIVPWHYALQADNANSPDYTFANIMAVVNPPGTNTPDIVSTASGHVYAPPQAETLTYDLDGNLISDGRWHYIWNGENRLVRAEEQISPTIRQPYVVEYAYDHQGRMVNKTIAFINTAPTKAISYLWDDFNIIAETTFADSATSTTYNVWGLDLDGTLQGAGGVGGLLAVVKDSATYIPAWDANGNIMEYVSADGTIVAHREYDSFGGTIVATGTVDALTHWFSTKPWCAVTGLSEYQYRKYSPVLGRWLNRDPIEEEGGLHVFGYCANSPISRVDWLGLEWNGSLDENGGTLTYTSAPYRTEGPLGLFWGYVEMSLSGTASYKVSGKKQADCNGPPAVPITRDRRLKLGFMSLSLTITTKYGERQRMVQYLKTTQYLVFTAMDTSVTISDKAYIWSKDFCKCFERTVQVTGNGTIVMNNAGILATAVVLENAIKFFPELIPILTKIPTPTPAPVPVL